MYKKLTFIMILTFTSINCQESKEQIAFDYFFENIFYKEYSIDKLQFSGNVENDNSSFMFYKPCFINKQYDMGIPEEDKNEKPLYINMDKIGKVKIKKSCNKNKLNVFRATKENEFYFVQIEINRESKYSESFFFKINSLNEVEEWCKSGIIW